MSPVEPVSGGIVSQVLLAVLKWAKGESSPEISESQFVQIAKVTVFGTNNIVKVSHSEVSGDEFKSIIERCFDAVLHQPGLQVAYTVGSQSGRTIRFSNIETYEVPDESSIQSYTIKSNRRGGAESNKAKGRDQPLTFEAEVVASSGLGVSPGKDISQWTAKDYASFTERVVGLPDDLNS